MKWLGIPLEQEHADDELGVAVCLLRNTPKVGGGGGEGSTAAGVVVVRVQLQPTDIVAQP